MAQLFRPSTNTVARAAIFAVILGLAAVLFAAELFTRSDYNTNVGVLVDQPISFSHKHHVKGLGLDCRFCHSSVNRAAYAGYPTTHVCMTCHNQIWSQSQALAKVRESLKDNQGLKWNPVYELPDHVYFNHSIHIQKGVACNSCHGDVANATRIAKVKAFYMSQCLECHRHVEGQSERLTNCAICHR